MSETEGSPLNELCTNSLDERKPPAQGGERPHVPMLLCDSAITPVVLGENSEPLYVGRTKRCVIPRAAESIDRTGRGLCQTRLRPPSTL
jgi:hypothetical protein